MLFRSVPVGELAIRFCGQLFRAFRGPARDRDLGPFPVQCMHHGPCRAAGPKNKHAHLAEPLRGPGFRTFIEMGVNRAKNSGVIRVHREKSSILSPHERVRGPRGLHVRLAFPCKLSRRFLVWDRDTVPIHRNELKFLKRLRQRSPRDAKRDVDRVEGELFEEMVRELETTK